MVFLRVIAGGVLLLAAFACGPILTDGDDGAVSCGNKPELNEWKIDCAVACNHVMSCKAHYSDSDLERATCNDCIGSCLAGVSLGGNDLIQSTDEDRRSWLCTEKVTDCGSLDHNCDIY